MPPGADDGVQPHALPGGVLESGCEQRPLGVLGHQLVDRPLDELVRLEAEDAVARGALVGDHAQGVDHGDHVGAVLDQCGEALPADLELGRARGDPFLQRGGELVVLAQRQHLAQDEQRHDRGAHPGHHQVAVPGAQHLDAGGQQGEHHRGVRQQVAQLAGDDGVLGRCVPAVLAGLRQGSQRSEQQEGEPGEPAQVDQVPRAVGAGRGLVGEAGVAHGEEHQPGADEGQGDRQDPVDVPRPQPGVQDDGDEHDVARGVGHRDDLRHHVVGACTEDRAEHDDPGAQEQRRGDHQPVEQGADPARPRLRGERETDQRGDRQRLEAEVAHVGRRGERHLPAQHGLVPRPDRLAGRPGQHRQAEQQPEPTVRGALVLLAPPQGGEAGGQCDETQAEVRQVLSDGRRARAVEGQAVPDGHHDDPRHDAARHDDGRRGSRSEGLAHEPSMPIWCPN